MLLPKFVGTVRNVKYKIILDEQTKQPKKYFSAIELEAFYDIFGENVSQWDYYAEVDIQATKRGRSKASRKDVWSCIIYLTEDQYAEREIEIGDIIELERPTLKKKDFKMYIYDSEQLQELPLSKIRRRFLGCDDCTREGRGKTCSRCKVEDCPDKQKHYVTYAYLLASDCRLSSHSYKIVLKADEVFVGTVGGIKVSFESMDEMRNFTEGEYYITPDEAARINNALITASGRPLDMRFYSRKTKIHSALVECKLSYDDTINSNVLSIQTK